MAFSLNDFDAKFGTTTQHAAGNTQWSSGAPVNTKPVKQDFFKNAVNTVATVPGQVAGAVGSSISKSFHDVAGGLLQGFHLPGQKSASDIQNQANEAYRQSIDAAGKRYHELYASGKLSKAAYTKLSKDLIEQSQSLSSDITGQVADMVTPKDFATGLATVGSLPLAGGALSGVTAGGKVAAITGAKATQAATPILKETLAGVAKGVAKGAIKYPLVTQPVAQAPLQLAGDIKHGDFGKAAGDAALLAAPAGLGLAAKGARALAPIIRDAAYGKSAVLTDAFGVNKVKSFIDNNPDKAAILKQMEQFTLDQPAVKNGLTTAGDFLASHLNSIGIDPKTATMDDIVNHFDRYAANVGRLQGAIKAGGAPAGAVISADFRHTIPEVVKRMETLGPDAGIQDRLRVVNQALDEMKLQNGTVRNKIAEAILSGGTAEDVSAIAQKLIVPIKGAKLEKGFIATIGPKDQAKLPSLSDAQAAGMPTIGTNPNNIVGTIAKTADKLGVGFRDYNTKQIGIAKDAFAKSVNKRDIAGVEGSQAYQTLSKLAEDKHVGDLRQLKVGEISQALDVSPANARVILGEAKKMYDSVPLSARGLAGKVQDLNQKINPLASGYARIQGKLRYDLNPAFRAQQRIEAATLGQVATGGHAVTGDVSGTVKAMRSDGFLPDRGGGYSGEAMKDVAGQTNVTTVLTPSEERSLARVLEATASKNGTTVADELQNEDTRRLMRAIVMNPKQGILSSNFAKATNLLFFPSAYNAKVTGIALKALASQPPAVQFGVIKGINDFHNWTKTDEGIKWQAKNSEVLGLINYFTPINSIEQTMNFLGTGNVRQLGLIGGLPFGVISRVLEGQGIVPKSNPPYLDPKTGELVPDKIPQTEKARMQQALGDIVDTMFTFPGRTAGLGSKTDLRNALTGNQLKPAQGETKSVSRTGELTPANKNTQRVLGTPAPTQSSSFPAMTRPATGSVGKPKIVPIFKASKPRRGKTLAKRPGTF